MSEPVHCPHGWVIKNDQCLDPSCLVRETQALEEQLRKAERRRNEAEEEHVRLMDAFNKQRSAHSKAVRERDEARALIRGLIGKDESKDWFAVAAQYLDGLGAGDE